MSFQANRIASVVSAARVKNQHGYVTAKTGRSKSLPAKPAHVDAAFQLLLIKNKCSYLFRPYFHILTTASLHWKAIRTQS